MAQNRNRLTANRKLADVAPHSIPKTAPLPQPADTVLITAGLATALYSHLKNGGTRIEADMLAEHIVTQSQAQQAQAQRAAEMNAAKAQAVAEYKASQAAI